MSARDSKSRPTAALHEGVYTVTDRTELHFDGAVYRPGDPVTLPDEAAAPLLADGIVAPAGARQKDPPAGGERKPPKGAKRKAAIRAAIEGLDKTIASNWTKDRKPDVRALEKVLDFDITAAERDEVHAEMEDS